MNPLRRALEIISRGRIIRRHLEVDGESVPIYVTPDAQLKYLKVGRHAFDRDLIDIARDFLKEDSVVWDVGANVGIFTFAAASVAHSGTVISIEADVWLASILRKTAALKAHRDKDIRVLPLAVSNQESIATFVIAARGRASNALEQAGGRSQMGGVREKQYVPTFRMDTLLAALPQPEFVKMDVEGAELMALEGAGQIIREVRPIFYIEIGDHVAVEIFDLFAANDYVATDPDSVVLKDRCAPNTFFIPKENRTAHSPRSDSQ